MYRVLIEMGPVEWVEVDDLEELFGLLYAVRQVGGFVLGIDVQR